MNVFLSIDWSIGLCMSWLARVSVLRLLNHFPHKDPLQCVGRTKSELSRVGRILLVVSYIIPASSSCLAFIFHTDSLKSALPTSPINTQSPVHNPICFLSASIIRKEKLSGLCHGVNNDFTVAFPNDIMSPSCKTVWGYSAQTSSPI